MNNLNIDIDYKPRPFQAAFHHGVIGKSHGMLICARQHGKTELACMETVDRALKGPENASYGFFSPYSHQARKVIWPRLKKLLAPLGKYVVFRETDLILTLPGNRKIHCLGADNEGCRGLTLRGYTIDEFDEIDQGTYQSAIVPTTASHPDAFHLFIGTLKRDGKLWKLYQGKRDDPDWYCQVTTASEAGLLGDDQLDRFRTEMGDSAYLREFECDASAPVEHSVIGDLINRAQVENRIVELAHQPMADVCAAWDLGLRDSTAIWLYQLAGHRVHVIGYREFVGLGLIDIINRLRQEYPSYNWGAMVLPHDINTRDYTSGVSRLDSFREMNFGDPRPLPRMLIEDGLHATRVNLARCVFDKDACARGLSHLKNACYEVDNKTGTIQNRVRHDDASHALDAFRYLSSHLEMDNPSASASSFTNRSGYSNWSVPINGAATVTNSRRRRDEWNRPIN